MPGKRVVKEFYYYNKDNKFFVDIIDGLGRVNKKVFENLSKGEVLQVISKIQEGKNGKWVPSKEGMKVLNQNPLQLDKSHIFNSYYNNIKSLEENNFSIVSNLLRSVGDLVSAMDVPIETPIPPPPVEINSPNDSIVSKFIFPLNAIDESIPISVINYLQDKLNTEFDLNNLTFRFHNLKWQLTKAISDIKILEPIRPRTSNTIASTMQDMINMIGLKYEMDLEINTNSFRFFKDEEAYRIHLIYTGE